MHNVLFCCRLVSQVDFVEDISVVKDSDNHGGGVHLRSIQ